MKKVLILAALGEALTGLILVVDPAIVIQVLFGSGITGAGIVMSRIAGISLIAFGIACWPGSGQAFYGMLTYSILATVYLVYLGIGGVLVGILLWPAVAAHLILSVLLIAAHFKTREKQVR